MKFIYSLIILLALAAAGFIGYKWYTAPEAERVTVEAAKITDVTPMLRLCTVEIYDDVPVKGTVDTRHFFAKSAVKGSISFDLENIDYCEGSDTISITLPKEIVEVYESTEPGAYKVIDTWNDSFFGSSNFTTAEENKIKAEARDSYRRNIYKRGLVTRARKEAAENLKAMLSGITGKVVIVNDPNPDGSI